ncbi:hypothetical protein A9Q84_15055 [Halobacteriovorax marinus]|uniref:Uncharacterized protein n=1 Tax=Halobacteriovorax marinus TaxID=97084 RepID=A0A1Y5F577_9BACT|nr:hypothetical protein A9Q84_15055 [Halobacteriovorax marinus]
MVNQRLTNITLNSLIGCEYGELISLRPLLQVDSLEDFYTKAMCAYYQNDSLKLTRIKNELKEIDQSEEVRVLSALLLFRIEMIQQVVTKEKIIELCKLSHPSWNGEIYSCAALALYSLGEFKQSQEYFIQSANSHREQGIESKAFRIEMNAVTMEGNIDPSNRLLFVYHDFATRALKAQQPVAAANAYLNIARELYHIRALNMAYKYCQLSLELDPQQSATLLENSPKALLIYILCGLGRAKEALTLLESFQVDQNLVYKMIKYIYFEGELGDIDLEQISPLWKLRLNDGKVDSKFGALENEAIDYLSKSARELGEIAFKLYPEIDEGDAINRATTLFSRINKKVSGLIILCPKSSKYKLSFNEPLELLGGKR